MKKNCWLILGAMLSTSLLAQQATNPTPAAPMATPTAAATLAPAPAKTSAPAAKAGKKKSAKAPAKPAAAKKKAAAPELKTVPLLAGPAVVVASNVNVRGQAKLKSEIVARVTKGQAVMVLEEIVRNNSGPEEPSAWAKILLPPNGHVWVNNAFIDSSNQTVKPKKLNVRSGPGENYSVIGLLHAGDVVKPMTTKGDWTEIEAPTNAYAFMAAQYLSQEAPATVAAIPPVAPKPAEAAPTPATVAVIPPVAPPPTEPAPTPTIVTATPPVAPPPTEAPAVPPPTEMPAPTETPAVTNAIAAAPSEPEAEEPLPPRIVQREGIVRGMTSIQAPSKFVLVSPENGRNIDYLYTASRELDLRRYKGLRIIVTGEEGLDERWGNTPVLTIQKILVVE